MRCSIARLARSSCDGFESAYRQSPPVAAQKPQIGRWLSHLVFRLLQIVQAFPARLRPYEVAALMLKSEFWAIPAGLRRRSTCKLRQTCQAAAMFRPPTEACYEALCSACLKARLACISALTLTDFNLVALCSYSALLVGAKARQCRPDLEENAGKEETPIPRAATSCVSPCYV